MKIKNRPDPVKAANLFIEKYFPNCDGAILAGSVVRGDATETSDLDIVVFDQNIHSSYRESLIEFGWPIELFVHNFTSYKDFFESDAKRTRPTLPRMVSEGVILKGENVIVPIQREADEILAKGPEKWTQDTINIKRYFLTDALDDFIGCDNRAEGIFIVGTLAELVSEFVLRTNNCWIGKSKWIVRSLKEFDEDFASRYVKAFDTYYKKDDKKLVIDLVDEVLQPYGGRLFSGFSLGKK